MSNKGVPLNRVKELREAQGMTQFQLSIRSEVAQSAISLVENFKISPYPRWREAIAKALGVEESEVFPDPEG